MDATDEFNSIHSSKAKAMLAKYYIGDLVKEKAAAVVVAAAADAATNGHANGHANGVASAELELVALNSRVGGVEGGSCLVTRARSMRLLAGLAELLGCRQRAAVADLPAACAAPPPFLTSRGANQAADQPPPLLCWPLQEKIPFKLAEKIQLSHNVRLFRFALQSPQHRFGLPVGKHVFLYASINGENVMRCATLEPSNWI
jgi:hypothetical protein